MQNDLKQCKKIKWKENKMLEKDNLESGTTCCEGMGWHDMMEQK